MAATIQIAPEDCTGCGLCVNACPAQEKDAEGKPTGRKAINMAGQLPLREAEAENWKFFLSLPEADRTKINVKTVKGSQLSKAPVRVFRRLRGLRRDAVCQAHDPAFRRPHAGCQRDGLLVDLRRQSADHPIHDSRGRARPGVVQLAFRR